jgi:hypothetical protein
MMTVLAREVASGFIIARVGWRFMNDANKSGPAASFSVHEGGIFRFSFVATKKRQLYNINWGQCKVNIC